MQGKRMPGSYSVVLASKGRSVVGDIDDHRVIILAFVFENLHQTSYATIQATDGLVVLSQLSADFGYVRQKRGDHDIFRCVLPLRISGKRLLRIAETVGSQRMIFDHSRPVRAMGAPVQEKRLRAADELTAILRHAHIIPSELPGGAPQSKGKMSSGA